MKYNFTKIVFKDLNGKVLENLIIHKTLAQGLYVGTADIDLLPKAMEINKGEETEFNEVEIAKFEEFINSKNCTLLAFIKKAILDYIKEVKEQSKTKPKKTKK